MRLGELVAQVKNELKQEGRYDMRTFGYEHFEHPNSNTYDTVEFYIYENRTVANHCFVTLTYDLMTGSRLLVTKSGGSAVKEKKVAGFERQGQTYFFSDEEPEHKILATLASGKLTKLKELPEDDSSKAYKAGKLLQEIDAVEHQVLIVTRSNFENLRDFVHHNI